MRTIQLVFKHLTSYLQNLSRRIFPSLYLRRYLLEDFYSVFLVINVGVDHFWIMFIMGNSVRNWAVSVFLLNQVFTKWCLFCFQGNSQILALNEFNFRYTKHTTSCLKPSELFWVFLPFWIKYIHFNVLFPFK